MTRPWREAVTRSAAPTTNVPEQPAGSPLDVSFIAVAYGTGPVMIDGITSIVDAMADEDLTFEVIVVDNEHPDVPGRSLRELALSTNGIRVVTTGRNLGFGGGCELGALHARGGVLAFVNTDILVQPGWIRPLLERLRSGAQIVAPVFLDPDGSIQEAGRVLYEDGATSAIVEPHSIASGGVRPDYASAACWLVHRDVHERLGGFDPSFHPAFYEDVELARRAGRLPGGLQVELEVRITHLRGGGTHGGSRTWDTSTQRDVLLALHPDVRWTQPRRPDAVR